LTTPFQLEESANAPWTSTTVGFVASAWCLSEDAFAGMAATTSATPAALVAIPDSANASFLERGRRCCDLLFISDFL
jgi:hypothetical protein